MKNVLTALACLLSVSLSAQTDLIYDGNGDGCVTIDDVLGLLIEYGQCSEEQEEFMACGDNINHEGYNYSTVQIGEQCWFSENCRYLPVVSPSNEGNTTDPYYYVYGYEGTDVAAAQTTDNYETYGVLYNWPAVMTGGICPSGWHIPSDGEFTQLTDFLGGEGVAGGKMKEVGYDHWISPNTGATNSSGWTGLAGGGRTVSGFLFYGSTGYCWSTSEYNPDLGAWMRALSYYDGNVYRNAIDRDVGGSARCVQD
jgi:uncharacterized protein (TIGR02145 family)